MWLYRSSLLFVGVSYRKHRSVEITVPYRVTSYTRCAILECVPTLARACALTVHVPTAGRHRSSHLHAHPKREEGTVDWDTVASNCSTGNCLSTFNTRISSNNSNWEIWARWGFPTVSFPLPRSRCPDSGSRPSPSNDAAPRRAASLREMGGAPRNPAPRSHFLVRIVKPSGCHCTDGHLRSRVSTEDRKIS